MMRKTRSTVSAKDSQAKSLVVQDPPQSTDYSDTQTNLNDWPDIHEIACLSSRKRKPINRYDPGSDEPPKRTKVVTNAAVATLQSPVSPPPPPAKRVRKEPKSSAPAKKKVRGTGVKSKKGSFHLLKQFLQHQQRFKHSHHFYK